MYIARILYPVRVLGPGERIGIWFAGCPRRCPGCSNPELWEQPEKWKTDARTVMRMVRAITDRRQADGFTLTGGDPFDQPEALRELLPELNGISRDILVYTGYEYEEIRDAHADILRQIAVLIDGKYIEAENRGSLLRGSDNQKILVLNPDYRERYGRYLREEKSRIQNFSTGDGIISVGIHRPGYEGELDSISRAKGLEAKP